MRTRKIVLVAVLFSATAVAGARQAVPPQGVPSQIAQILAEIKKRDTGMLAVSEEDGKFLRMLIGTRNAQRVLEIGGASGYSAIWMGLGLRDTNGHLTTIEYDTTRAKEAKANVERAGLASVVQVINGDAFVEIPKITGTFDAIFLDAWKPDYKKFFDMTFRRLDPGGVFLAHNVVNKKNDMQDFLQAITTRPDAWTNIITPSGEGISITYKKRK